MVKSLPPQSGKSRISKKIRDLERLLKRDNLNPVVKTESERALHSFKTELNLRSKQQIEKKHAKKYHLLKFVERKKILRKLKKHPNLDNLSLYYYIHTYPNNQKYQALFADKEHPPTEESHKHLKTVKTQMANNELDTSEEFINSLLNKKEE